jgi:hypothetical protein
VKKQGKFAAVILALALTSSYSPAHAQTRQGICTVQQKSAVKAIITKQINALTKSDWQSAYNYSALAYQSVIPLELFTQTIKNQYVFLVFNDGFGFGACKTDKNTFSQTVTIDYHGVKHILAFGLTLVNKRLGVVAANEVVVPVGLPA